INKSKPPFGGAFAATTSLSEGTAVAAGQTLTETVTFSPTATGPSSGTWLINGDDNSGLHTVQFTGAGTSASTVTGSGNGTPPVGPGPTPPAKPASISPTPPRFVPGVAAITKLRGIDVSYTAKAAGVRRFVLERATSGRRGAHGCVAAT